MMAGEEPDIGPMPQDIGRITWPWQNTILGILMEQMKLGDPDAEEAILWLRARWGFEEADTRRRLDRWKAICAAEEERSRGNSPRIVPSEGLEAAIRSEAQPKPPRSEGETPA